MWAQSESQQQLKQLEAAIKQLELDDKQSEFSGSYWAFYQWLKTTHPEIFRQAQDIASDIRLWRNTQDVLRQVWKRIYQR